ncbi:MAG: hypothetical protein ACC662_07295 [Planctomycetota bacterium]
MRTTVLILLIAGLGAFLPACGGGGTGAGAALPQALVLGVVTTRDGPRSTLDAVTVSSSTGTGKAVTDAGGGFALSVPSGTTFRLRFDDPASQPTKMEDDVGETEDDTPDDTDIAGSEVEVRPLEEGEVLEIEVELSDGEVIESWTKSNEGDGEGFEGEAKLVPPDGKDDSPARGEVEVECKTTCCRMEVEVEGVGDAAVLEIVLVDADGQEASLGVVETNAEGEGHFVLELCEGDEMPLGATSLADLAGTRIQVVNGDGVVVLTGLLPGNGAQHDERDHCKAEFDLLPPDAAPEPEAEGEGVVKTGPEGEVLVVEVEEFSATGMLDVALVSPEGDEAAIGEIELGEAGSGRLAVEYADGDARPFDAESLTDLAGYTLRVTDADGVVVLEGILPLPKCEDDEEGDDDGKEPEVEDFALTPPDGAANADAEGGGVVKQFTDCSVLVLEVGHVAAESVFEVVLVDPDSGDEVALDGFDTNADGGGRFVKEFCEGLPFEAASWADLAGYGVEIANGDGVVVLEGTLPSFAEEGDGE